MEETKEFCAFLSEFLLEPALPIRTELLASSDLISVYQIL